MFEIVKKRKYSKGWLVIVKITSSFCGCMMARRVLEFEQEEEPTEEEIRCKL